MRTRFFLSVLAMLLMMMTAVLFVLHKQQIAVLVTSTSTASSNAQQAALVQAYQQLLYAQIAAAQSYPMLSRRRGDEGVVQVRFVLQASGEISQLVLVESSGVAALDEAALAIFSHTLTMRLTPIPAALNKASWQFSIPIAYQLVAPAP